MSRPVSVGIVVLNLLGLVAIVSTVIYLVSSIANANNRIDAIKIKSELTELRRRELTLTSIVLYTSFRDKAEYETLEKTQKTATWDDDFTAEVQLPDDMNRTPLAGPIIERYISMANRPTPLKGRLVGAWAENSDQPEKTFKVLTTFQPVASGNKVVMRFIPVTDSLLAIPIDRKPYRGHHLAVIRIHILSMPNDDSDLR